MATGGAARLSAHERVHEEKGARDSPFFSGGPSFAAPAGRARV